MRILMAADVAPFVEGSGAERLLQAHARELARRGHEVRIVFRSEMSTHSMAGQWEGCSLYPYTIDRGNSLSFWRTTVRNGTPALRAATDGWKPEVVNIHQPFTGFVVTRRRAPAPVLYTFLSPAPAEYERQKRGAAFYGPVVRSAIRWTEDFVLRRADRISVLSDFMRDEIIHWHPAIDERRIVQIAGGADTDWFRPVEDRERLKASLGCPLDRRLLLTVRNLEARTGVGNLIEAVAELARARRDFVLWIAGRGPLEDALHARVIDGGLQDVVRFLGFVAEESLVELYAAADFYIQPDTDLQGFGLPIVEALACGTPVLATPVGGAIDILQPFDPRLLFSGLDPHAIAAELSAALDDPELAGDRRRYRAMARDRFAWPRIVDQIETVFESLVASHEPETRTP